MKCDIEDKEKVQLFNDKIIDKLKIRKRFNTAIKPIKNIITKPETIIVFDVEHTGCHDKYILQLSWGIYKLDGSLITMKDYYLKPTHEIYVNPFAIEKTGLSYDVLLEKQIHLILNYY